MTNINRYINELHQLTNSIDFKGLPFNPKIGLEYISMLSRFTGSNPLPTFIMNYPTKEIDFVRAVSYKKPNESYRSLDDLWYPRDSQKIRYAGRANFPYKSIFYCTDVPGTAFFETKPKGVGEKIALLTFNVRKNLRLLAFGMSENFNGNLKFSEKEIALNLFFGEKFKQEIHHYESHLYYPTAIMTNLFISDPQIDGIIYPSTASNLRGENIALKTSCIDQFHQIKEARLFEVIEYKSKLDFTLKCKSVSNDFKNGKINWIDVKCDGHQITENIYH